MPQQDRTRGNGEGSVYQRIRPSKNPNKPAAIRWVAQVRIDGKLRRSMHDTEALAKKALRKMIAELDSGKIVVDGNETLGALLTRWEDAVLPAQNLATATLDNYAWACTILRDNLGRIRLRRLTPDDIEACFQRLAAEGMSRASLVKIRSVLGKTLDYAHRRGLVNHNVARIVELPADARRTEPGRSLTAEQAKAVLASSEGHPLHGMWVVMLYLGLRPGEAAGLSWKDIDFDQGVIHVRRSLKLERGELRVDERLKTGRSRRSLDAPPPVIDALTQQQQLQTEAKSRADDAWDDTFDLVFTTSFGTPHHPSNIQRTISALTTRLGYGHWHPHELRHSAASLMSEAGVPIERIADQLGHDGTRMSLLVYRHATKPTINAGTAMTHVLQ
jgi:integrase